MMEVINLHDAQALAEKLGDRIERILKNAIEARGAASLVVSGGSTPKPLFQYLSKKELDWSKVLITLADERCVPFESEQSNTRLVHEHLMQNKAADAIFVDLHTDNVSLEESEMLADKTMSEMPSFDCLILGMGSDGHTASIFPEALRRDEALDTELGSQALLVDPVTVDPMRITMTAKRILDAELIVLHISGDEKAKLLTEVVDAPDAAKWPISFFLTQRQTPIAIYKTDSLAPEQTEEQS